MSKLNSGSDHIKVDGHIGTWYVIDSCTAKHGDQEVRAFLLEHETYGDEAPCVIVDENANLIMEGVFNGFYDLEEAGWVLRRDEGGAE